MKSLFPYLLPILALSSIALADEAPRYGCTFGNGRCVSQILACASGDGRDCQNHLTVDCAGSVLYDGYFVSQATEGQTLIQGITTVRFPTPPAITIQPGDEDRATEMSGGKDRLDAHLFDSAGVISGSCRLAQ